MHVVAEIIEDVSQFLDFPETDFGGVACAASVSNDVGVAYSADAPDADVKLRIAAISALPVTALPKTPTRAVAGDIESHPATVGAAVPHVAARHAAISHQNATACSHWSVRTATECRSASYQC
jgi:hypothetical protein